MRVIDHALRLSPTDLASFLGCCHRTGLDLAVAHGVLGKPHRSDPLADALRARGEEHERHFVNSLRAAGLDVVDLRDAEDAGVRTLEALRAGADAMVQAELQSGAWTGYVDVLRKVPRPSALGPWSYEAYDTKLARDTRGATILQLSAYSHLLADIQGLTPRHFHVVTPDPVTPIHTYRLDDYAAYYRLMREKLLDTVALGHEAILAAHYPEPVEPCEMCRWIVRCNARRRADDHLSFVAGLSRLHRGELVAQGYDTLARAAAMPLPVPFKPARGARPTYERLREQARLQLAQRVNGQPVFELLDLEPDKGLCLLAAPSAADLFLDLEGDPFARDGGREYLFGIGRVVANGSQGEAAFDYRSWWAFDDAGERAAFEAVLDLIVETLDAHPDMHVYHFGHYEPSAFKRLMGRYATRAETLDRLLRGRRFVNLHAVVRGALRAGVESYSIKKLEPLYAFVRDVGLDDAGHHLRALELALESQAPHLIAELTKTAVEGYNRDDCRSTLALRDWLEARREELTARVDVPRPTAADEEPSDRVKALDVEVEQLRARLLKGVSGLGGSQASSLAGERVEGSGRRREPSQPQGVRLPETAPETMPARMTDGGAEAPSVHPTGGTEAPPPHHHSGRTTEQQARWLLAYLIDWHRREEKADWWEFFRLCELEEDDLLDEPKAIAGLEYVERRMLVTNKRTGRPTGSVIDRYTYPGQDVDIRPNDRLKMQSGTQWGTVEAIDRDARLIDVKKSADRADEHPRCVFAESVVSTETLQRAVMRLAESFLEGHRSCATGLLFRLPPRLRAGVFAQQDDETAVEFAVRIAPELDRTTFAIQGPPGSGKTYAGARMIGALVGAGFRVGVTAVSHKVIRNLLDATLAEAGKDCTTLRAGHKVNEVTAAGSGVLEFCDNDAALGALASRDIDVLGGTAWLWAREDAADTVDVLFVDEAGQMSLANVLAVAQAAKSVVLLGDPQQLDQPASASHPDGIGVSALHHVLGGAETMPTSRGLFLPNTWRLAPAICAFTSEVFYEGKLQSKPGLERQRLVGTGAFDGAGLWWVPADHDGNQNFSLEEVEIVSRLVDRLLAPGARWIDERGIERQLAGADLRIVAPYNAQVNRLAERLAGRSVPVGTVDKFQGQEAPVVIYSMATSRPEDAPRGMEFLYSLNRLNVATSRARCVAILVASPRLFEPECRTPRQMRLANALCRYRELAAERAPVA